MKTKHSYAARRLLATRLCDIRKRKGLPYRTIGEALASGKLQTNLRNSIYRHYRNVMVDAAKEQYEAAGLPFGNGEWDAAHRASRDLPISVLIEDVRTADLNTFRNVGKKGLAALRELLT